MWNKPTEQQLSALPKLYETDLVELKDKIIHMHFFIGGSDWYAAEYCPDERVFFGFVILNSDEENAEWGLFSLDELIALRSGFVQIDRDLHWKVQAAEHIDKISSSQGWNLKRSNTNV